MISQKAKYALRALVALAKEGKSLMIGEIAARETIPRKFLTLIIKISLEWPYADQIAASRRH